MILSLVTGCAGRAERGRGCNMRLTDWVFCGYADAQERTPRKRAPNVPEEELCIVREQAAPEVRAYWDGFDGGILDGMRQTLRNGGL